MAFFIRQFVPQFIYVRRQIAGMPKERAIRMITIDAKKKQKDFVRFWDGFVFHPTDAIEDDWGQRILDRISSDKAAKMVRIYTMMEDIVTLDENGEMRYNFALNDYRLDYLLSRGFDIMLTYAFLPPWLTVDADKTSSVAKKKTRYKGKMIVASYAKDYGKWQEICRKYTEHIVNRYGEETVAKWRLQCYNEPNLDFFFMAGEVSLKRRCEEYCKIYDGFEAGVIVLTADGQLLNREGSIVYDGDGGETLLGGWAKVYRKDRTRASYEEVKLSEYDTGKSLWNGKKATMIRKVALVHALREAFPSTFGALYDESEVSVHVDAESTAREVADELPVLDPYAGSHRHCKTAGTLIPAPDAPSAEESADDPFGGDDA